MRGVVDIMPYMEAELDLYIITDKVIHFIDGKKCVYTQNLRSHRLCIEGKTYEGSGVSVRKGAKMKNKRRGCSYVRRLNAY